MDIAKMIKEQSAKQIEELKVLSGKLSEQLKKVINLIPEGTRQKSVEDFLHGIRESVFGKAAPRKYQRRAKKTSAQEKPKKARATRARGRGRKKTSASVMAAEEKTE